VQAPYSETITENMKFVFSQLSEKSRRLFAGLESQKLERGGQKYIADLFGCSPKTVRRGEKELKDVKLLPEKERTRHKGGGRKRILEKHPELNEQFERVLAEDTAGSPMNEEIRWTNLTPNQIAEELSRAEQSVSAYTVKQLFKKNKFRKRKARKSQSLETCLFRDEQFKNIASLRKEFFAAGLPVISIDTKKKELLGNLYRDGHLYTKEVIRVYDHDFPYLAEGVIIPYTIYDIRHNRAYVYLGTSKDTAEFVADCIRHWWLNYGSELYPSASALLVLADGGGSNSSRHFIFKSELETLANDLSIQIRMAHYPPYTSKWNPVEHRVFPHLTRAMQGVILTSHQLVQTLLERATTRTGLKVVVNIIEKIYQTGRKVADNYKETMRIVFDDFLGQWNYRAIPLASPL
jgi:hypothetical protein